MDAAAGLDPNALARLRDAFGAQIAQGVVPGVVLHVERRGQRWTQCLGAQDPARGVAMHADAIFRIYSMTKPVVSVALMMLAEQGLLRLRDPLARYLPAFDAVRVGVERDGALERVVPRRAITLHDLLRHTAGLTYEFHAPSAVRTAYAAAGLYSRRRSNTAHVDALARLPLMHEPGTVWDYSRATDVLGRVVEVVAGAPLGEHLQRTVFAPLGMVDTGFAVAPRDHDRIAEPFPARPGAAVTVPVYDARVDAALENGGGGLLSTAADYARFLRALLNGGTLDGVRLLGRKTVEFMTADHLGALPRSGDLLPPGHGFGLGFAVRTALGEHTEPGSIGSYGWSGAAGTAFFVDPREAMFGLLLAQAPEHLDDLRELFRQLVYAAIDA